MRRRTTPRRGWTAPELLAAACALCVALCLALVGFQQARLYVRDADAQSSIRALHSDAALFARAAGTDIAHAVPHVLDDQASGFRRDAAAGQVWLGESGWVTVIHDPADDTYEVSAPGSHTFCYFPDEPTGDDLPAVRRKTGPTC